MKKILYIFSAIAILAGFTACNKDMSGDKEVAELKEMLLDDKGNVAFNETPMKGLYQLGVESKEDAAALAGIYAGSGFTGDNYTRTISGNKGLVKVTKGTEGVFYSVQFKVEGIPSFTLDIIDANGENNDAQGESGTYHKCLTCGRYWRGSRVECPWTPIHNK